MKGLPRSAMRRRVAVLVAGSACLARFAMAEKNAPAPNDFAFGCALDASTNAAVFRSVAPESLYRRIVDRGLGDVRVFNGAGQEVPHAVRPVPDIPSAREDSRDLPLFPLSGEAANPSTPIRVEVSSTGAVVRVETPPAPVPTASPAYLLDATSMAEPPTALWFRWEETDNVWASLVVESSPDLQRWTAVGSGAIAALQHLGQRLERRSVELRPPALARYFRVTARRGRLPSVTSVAATTQTVSYVDGATSLVVRAEEIAPTEFHFDLGGPFPVVRLQLALKERNTLVQAKVASSADRDGPYETRHEGLFYRLDGETPLESAPVALRAPVRARHWRLTLDGRGGGVGGIAPEFTPAYLPDEIVWVARGDAPFTLAYGNSLAKHSSFEAAELLAQGVNAPTAAVGEERELGGLARLTAEPTAKPLDWKRASLWTLLSAAALLLIVLSVRLARRAGAS